MPAKRIVHLESSDDKQTWYAMWEEVFKASGPEVTQQEIVDATDWYFIEYKKRICSSNILDDDC